MQVPDFIVQGLTAVGIGLALVLALGWKSVRSRSRVKRWAEQRGLTLLRAEPDVGLSGPFWRDPGFEYISFAVRDAEGKVRTGWISLPLLGPLDLERAEVRREQAAAGDP